MTTSTATLPMNIRHYLAVITSWGANLPYEVSREGRRITVTITRGEWTLKLTFHGRHYTRANLELTKDGEKQDISDLSEAIRLLMGGTAPLGETGRPAVAGPAQAARTNSTMVRRSTVIRV